MGFLIIKVPHGSTLLNFQLPIGTAHLNCRIRSMSGHKGNQFSSGLDAANVDYSRDK